MVEIRLLRRKVVLCCLGLAVLICFFSVFAAATLYDRMVWASGLGFGLPFYNSTVEATDNLYLKSFYWDTSNATSVTWRNVHMSTGEEWDSLTVSSDVNVTFSVVNSLELTYGVPGNGTQVFRGVTEPLSVTVDGALVSDYTYTSGVLTVGNASSTVDIIFAGSGLSVEDAVAIGVLFGIIAIAVSIVFVYSRRKKQDEGENSNE